MPCLTELPAELLPNIFAQLATLEDVVNLAASNRRLRSVWRDGLNGRYIFTHVAARSVECFEQAKLLLSSQAPQLFDDTNRQYDIGPEAVSRLFGNRRRLQAAIELWEEVDLPLYAPRCHNRAHFTDAERRRFSAAWFTLLAYLTLPEHQRNLDHVTLRSLHTIFGILQCYSWSNDFAGRMVTGMDTTKLQYVSIDVYSAMEQKSLRLLGRFQGTYVISKVTTYLWGVLDYYQDEIVHFPDLP